MSRNLEYVLFKLDNESYGLNIHNVETIEKIMPITRVPYTDDYVMGVINLRGNVVPVIDLRKRFDLTKKELDEDSRVIIVKVEDITVGMIVDSSSEVVQFTDDQIDDAPSIKNNNEESYIRCIGKIDNRIVLIIDLYRVLNITHLFNE